MDQYAHLIRILGRGPTNSRHLTRAEACEAFCGVMDGTLSDLQLGALLLLLRYRSENADELAGIIDAIRQSLDVAPPTDFQDLIDWPTYSAGKSRGLPWFLLAAKLMAENGHKVFMHGYNSHLENGIPTEDCLDAVDETACASLQAAQQKLTQENFAFLPLRNFSPRLLELLQLRKQLGVRSIMNTAVRLINPLHARTLFLGIFHPPYIELNRKAAKLLEQPTVGVIKGGGGEAERNPFKQIALFQIQDGEEHKNSWPASLDKRQVQDGPVTVEHFRAFWHGEARDERGLATMLGTLAQALYLVGAAQTIDQAEQLARVYWQNHLTA